MLSETIFQFSILLDEQSGDCIVWIRVRRLEPTVWRTWTKPREPLFAKFELAICNSYFRVMQWYTPFTIPKSPFPISHQSKILSLGSCFAETIGQKMAVHKFDCSVNPFGTVFNPVSLVKLLETALHVQPWDEAEILEREGLFFHYSSHSDLVAVSREELIQKLDHQADLCKKYLEQGSHLILTFGTAWIYELAETGTIVANCHKQPSTKFKKRLLSSEEMKGRLKSLLGYIANSFPNLKVILTVSPVRHIKDGIPENQLSKSLLRVLCSDLEKEFPFVSYFPAYEIMMDELRDYRFYKADLIHPTEGAENYIWEKWLATYFTDEAQQKSLQIDKINQELTHRPLNPHSEAHRKFLNNLLQKLERLNTEFDFSSELSAVKKQLNSESK